MTLLIIYQSSLHILFSYKNAISYILFSLFDQRILYFTMNKGGFFLGVMAQWSGKLMFILVELKGLQINNLRKNRKGMVDM